LEALEGTDDEPREADHSASCGIEEEGLCPLGGVMCVLVLQVLHVLQTLERLSTHIVKDTTEGAIVNGLEIFVSAEGRVLLVTLLEMVLRAEVLVSVRWVDNMLLNCILKYHILFI
jgi:hypothetical protein